MAKKRKHRKKALNKKCKFLLKALSYANLVLTVTRNIIDLFKNN